MSTTTEDRIAVVEHALLTGILSERIDDASDILQLTRLAVQGDYDVVLASPSTSNLLARSQSHYSHSSSISDVLSQFQPSGQDEELLCLIVLSSALHAFLQANWTGPDLPDSLASLPALRLSEDMNASSIAELAYGGEPAYHLASHASLLRLAQILGERPYSHLKTITWWRLRIWTIHLYILDGPVAVPENVSMSFSEYRPSDSVLGGRYLLELGLLEHLLHSDKQASDRFVESARATGLRYELTGALGKRTKFQIHEHSQLVLLAESKSGTHDSAGVVVPETLQLNDDTLLEHTQFTSSATASGILSHIDPGNQPELDPLDQCILLAMCLNVRNTSPAHGLTNEQMTPYVERVITHPRNWSVHTMALLLRSRLESGRTRTIERSTLQLQALIDQLPSNDSTPCERLRYIFDLALPSKWELERELATRLMSIGVIKSALDIFTRLEMWEEAVRCYAILEMPEAGIKIISDLLSGARVEANQRRRLVTDKARKAKLTCLLGDLSPFAERELHYLHAWTLSGNTSGRAARSLGAYYFGLARYSESIPFLEHGARINPLLSRTWFLLGCAHMRNEKPDWLGARDAFARCVAIDDEDGEAWSNLATCYLQMSDMEKHPSSQDKDETGNDLNEDLRPEPLSRSERQYAARLAAFRALREGLKHAHDNWRMWENYMLVSLEVGELHECVRALGRAIELRGDGALDEDVLDRLVRAAIPTGTRTVGTLDHDPQTLQPISESSESQFAATAPGSLSSRVADLFDRIVLPRISTPRVFRAYARLNEARGAYAVALKACLDAHRTAQPVHPPETLQEWQDALHETEETLDALRTIGPQTGNERWRVQARGIVRSFVSRSRNFDDESDWSRVEAMQDQWQT